MYHSNTACASGISKSASPWTSGTLSSKPWVGQWVPRTPENKRYILYQLYIQVCILYIHGILVYTWYIHGIYWCKMKAHGGCWVLFDVCGYIPVIYIYIYIYIYILFILYILYIHGIYQLYAVLINMSGIYLVNALWVCSVPFLIMIYLWYTMHIKRNAYQKNIHSISKEYNYKKGYRTNPWGFY